MGFDVSVDVSSAFSFYGSSLRICRRVNVCEWDCAVVRQKKLGSFIQIIQASSILHEDQQSSKPHTSVLPSNFR